MTIVKEYVESRPAFVTQGVDTMAKTYGSGYWATSDIDTEATAAIVSVEELSFEAPYAELVFQALQALPDKAPDLPCDADDDL